MNSNLADLCPNELLILKNDDNKNLTLKEHCVSEKVTNRIKPVGTLAHPTHCHNFFTAKTVSTFVKTKFVKTKVLTEISVSTLGFSVSRIVKP